MHGGYKIKCLPTPLCNHLWNSPNIHSLIRTMFGSCLTMQPTTVTAIKNANSITLIFCMCIPLNYENTQCYCLGLFNKILICIEYNKV